MTAFLGTRAAIVVDNAATYDDSEGHPQSLVTFITRARAQRPGVMALVVSMLERMLGLYDRVVGKAPPVDVPHVDRRLGRRMPIEVSLLDGAGGE